MNTKSPECWDSDPQARAVRIEISPERSLLLPFDEFLSAELVTIGKEQELKLIFAAHEVLIRGHSLRRIETAMQRMELSLITKVMDDYRPLIAQGQPVILEIIVSEIKPPAPRPNTIADSDE